ncbi:MAG: hypothetical protein AB7K71_39685 [Polyangiaceae bacterium]
MRATRDRCSPSADLARVQFVARTVLRVANGLLIGGYQTPLLGRSDVTYYLTPDRALMLPGGAAQLVLDGNTVWLLGHGLYRYELGADEAVEIETPTGT